MHNLLKLLRPLLLAGLCCGGQFALAQEAPDAAAREAAAKIAAKAGISAWDKIGSISFTFNIDRGGNVTSRAWNWKPKAKEVTAVEKHVTYTEGAPTADQKAINDQFINDQYWLIFAFHLVWDTQAALELTPDKVPAPISATPLHKLTIKYPRGGDSYDLFYNDDFVVQEWVFRKGSAPEPTLKSTWEGYRDIGGLRIPLEHKMPNGARLWFSDVSVTTVD